MDTKPEQKKRRPRDWASFILSGASSVLPLLEGNVLESEDGAIDIDSKRMAVVENLLQVTTVVAGIEDGVVLEPGLTADRREKLLAG